MKYVLVTGGVISGIGKGVISSSVGTLLKACDVSVTSIKIDPYINIDAGTFSPYEHGEVFVLDDGGEVDLDLGNYERFMDVKLHRDNNITTGKIYQSVIEKERHGDFLGKTVQVVPHITNAIQDWVERVAHVPVDGSDAPPQVCIIELGGTIGDIEGMPFVEAFRQFQFRVGRDNICCIHVSLVPEPGTTGDQKTKPTQNSVRELRGLGLTPDLIAARSVTPLQNAAREKISSFCHVSPKHVIGVSDVSSIYRVPFLLHDQGILSFLSERLKLPLASVPALIGKWQDLANRHESPHAVVKIALVGKYTGFKDAYTSVCKALEHAALAIERRLEIIWIESCCLEEATCAECPVKYHSAWERMCQADGILVPGGFGHRGVEGKIRAAGWARKRRTPFLGVCLGMQCAVIDFARDVLGSKNAHSTEFDPVTDFPAIVDMPEHHPGHLGGTMRLGSRPTVFQENCSSLVQKLYNGEVNPDYVDEMESKGLLFVGRDETGQRMEICELSEHPFFVGVQFHPEYISRPLKPSPVYRGLLLAASGGLDRFLDGS